MREWSWRARITQQNQHSRGRKGQPDNDHQYTDAQFHVYRRSPLASLSASTNEVLRNYFGVATQLQNGEVLVAGGGADISNSSNGEWIACTPALFAAGSTVRQVNGFCRRSLQSVDRRLIEVRKPGW